MNTDTRAAIERLREWAENWQAICPNSDDVKTVCTAAEQRDDLLAKIEREERGDASCQSTTRAHQSHSCRLLSDPATKFDPEVAGESLRRTAEKIIEGVPISYRDGDEGEGRERTLNWLMELLREFGQRSVDEFTRNHHNPIIAYWHKYKDIAEKDIERLLQKLEHTDADTKRLDWLEENKRGVENHYNEDTKCNDWWVDETWNLRKIGHTIREAIDAAIKEEK